MTVQISSRVLHRIIAAAQAVSDREICGILWGARGRIRAETAARNVAAEPATRFEIDPTALIMAHRRARRHRSLSIVGHYHSHPSGNPVPSPRDADAANPDGSLWLIVAGKRARLWRAVERGSLHGRFEPVEIAVEPDAGTDKRVDKGGMGVRMQRTRPNEGPLMEFVA